MDIDLVYLWVDGSDPAWRARRDATIGKPNNSELNCEGRFADNGELMYSLRSVEKYAPWIRTIFIVTDGQTPAWLNTNNSKVVMIHQADIMPKECSPCFNSGIIEHHLHNIPGIAEHFLYANDDMFLNKPVTPSTFFTLQGLPIVRLLRRPFRKTIILLREKLLHWHTTNYGLCLHNAASLVERQYGTYYSGKPHHNVDAYTKSTFLRVHQLFSKEIAATLGNHRRSPNDIQRIIYSLVPLAEKKAVRQYVDKHTSLKFSLREKDDHLLQQYNPTFFCVSDSQKITDADRQRVREFLQQLFPDKSQFEK